MAPLQESLAAAVLYLNGFGISIPDLEQPDRSSFQDPPADLVFDPFCGSGTMLIEAALIASRTPPGFWRKMDHWGFTVLPEFSLPQFESVKATADSSMRKLAQVRFFGTDIDQPTIRAAEINARAAGVGQAMSFKQFDCQKLDEVEKLFPRKPSMIVSNPPYGIRVNNEVSSDSDKNVRPLYSSLGTLMKNHTQKPATAGVIATAELAKKIGLIPKRKIPVHNGGKKCVICTYDLFDGPAEDRKDIDGKK